MIVLVASFIFISLFVNIRQLSMDDDWLTVYLHHHFVKDSFQCFRQIPLVAVVCGVSYCGLSSDFRWSPVILPTYSMKSSGEDRHTIFIFGDIGCFSCENPVSSLPPRLTRLIIGIFKLDAMDHKDGILSKCTIFFPALPDNPLQKRRRKASIPFNPFEPRDF